jgi:AcrR family transcriptional regulator
MTDQSESLAMSAPARGQFAKRKSILDAAAAVFYREGYAGASIDLIADEAGVSRQTIYNHHRDKETLFAAVVKEIDDRASAGWYATLETFPDRPKDVEAELTAFATRLLRNCTCNADATALRKLINAEGERYPELFAAWREYGPGRSERAIAGCLARLAHSRVLKIADTDVAARQFLALINADLNTSATLARPRSDAEIKAAAANGVKTFLMAFSAGTGKTPTKRKAP